MSEGRCEDGSARAMLAGGEGAIRVRRVSVRPVTTDARVALLEHLVDHAPTFPPASLPPADALAEDARAQASPHAFMLGRLVWPASRLGELGGALRVLSVVADAPVPDDTRIEAIEVPPGTSMDFRGGTPAVFLELSLDSAQLADDVAALGRLGLVGAKVRCGGAATPSVAQLAGFIRACREYGVPFKATAGLHHAVRRGNEHGFLNLLAAAVFGDEEQALADEDDDSFGLDATSFRWRDRRAGPEELERARAFLRSIGSCSFFEPVEELEGLRMLP